MDRTLLSHLHTWKDTHRSPLLLRGARQVGKSYCIQEFGRKAFKNTVAINFDLRPDLKPVFELRDPGEILRQIELLFRETISPDTLLFLDEIQECPSAIRSLRYFKEMRPDLFVIGAGSLLEFAFTQPFEMPVGRIQFLNLGPLSFYEFLQAAGEERMIDFLKSVTLEQPVPDSVHARLLSLLRTFCMIGGMPEVVVSYLSAHSPLQASYVQDSLIETYKHDFSKYGSSSELSHLQTILQAIPRMVSEQIKYVNIDRDARSRDLKQALHLLSRARVITPVAGTDASGLPFGATPSNRYKYIFLDVGLMQHICGLDSQILGRDDLMLINKGAIAEQYVGQELLAHTDPFLSTELYFWARDKKGSSSEIDYCISHHGVIYPIEVKSGSTGKLRSLRVFIDEKNPPFGIRFWEGGLHLHDGILSIPLYMTGELNRLIDLALTEMGSSG